MRDSHFKNMNNRAIRFRVWDKKEKKWFYGPKGEVNLFGETIILGEFMRVSLEHLEECIPLQFTGIKDKNGKEIYEGDIIRYSIRSDNKVEDGEVFYDEEFAMFLFNRQHEFNFMDWVVLRETIEVVGNIFENKNLVK